MRIKLLAEGFDTQPLLAALATHPHLWDENTARTQPIDSPHHGLSDIWARYAPEGSGGWEEHDSVWYPSAVTPALEDMADELMTRFEGERLGGVLVTRIPPGTMCKPHRDEGWHAGHYEKIAVQLAASPDQPFSIHGEQLISKPRDVYWFDNSHEHWVTNDGPHTRVTAIFCIKTKAFDSLKERDECHSQ